MPLSANATLAGNDLFDRQLLFVTGKGGVGKSTAAAALSIIGAEAGKRTLLVEIDAKGHVAELFAVPAFGAQPEEIQPNLYGLTIDTELALREYLKLNMKIPMMGRIGTLARIFDFVATAAPGVKEILTIGKISWEAGLEGRESSEWDLIVVDATATGHIVGQLNAHRSIREMVSVGVIREQTEEMAELLEDPERTGVVLVATPEEMPVSETIDLYGRFTELTNVDIAAVLVNRVLPELFTKAEAEIFEGMRDPGVTELLGEHLGHDASPILDAAELAVTLRRTRGEHLKRLRESVPLPMYYVPNFFVKSQGLRITRLVAQALSEEFS